ncbi:MAG: uracil-DNA glycosylase [Candidatus Levybacteria bacterium]|nr:uracil-DNA glycosylase [Candidatus Levybacteria bacterium]
MNKEEALQEIALEIENCDICKVDKHGKAVPGEGNPDADVLFVGEAPGRTEAETGRPFIGRSGKLLRKLINESGLKEEEVYITSPVKYLPDYITPKPSDIEHGFTHFGRQIEIIDPKIIVLLGRVACLAVLKQNVSVVLRHGEIIEDNGRKYFITVHPAAALRFVKMKQTLLEDFIKLRSLVGN